MQLTYTKIRENIWQIAEDKGVFCTLVKGTESAILVDTGYGAYDLKAFLEANVNTPYIVINSHGHPDHIGGNYQFDKVYALKEEWDVIQHFKEKPITYSLKEIKTGEIISLGNIHIEIVPLAGHTRGSSGFLVPEEKLLIAGDALNEGLWLFNYGSLSMKHLYNTLKKTMKLNFNSYLGGHSNIEYQKEKLLSHINNIENLKVDKNSKHNLMGFEVYSSKYEDIHGKSEIIFTEDKAVPVKSYY